LLNASTFVVGMSLKLSRSAWLILLLWAAVTLLDLNKAYHIDDTFHLKAAQWISGHPLEPMSGMVNWGHDPEPIHNFNQPPGFFYLVAVTGHLFGWGEAPMHAMRSLFTLLALVCFHGLARRLAGQQALWLTALFALCPAFMVNQGLMTDVPLLALQLLFFHLLLVPGRLPEGWRLLLAAVVVSAALFIKYTTLPLLVLFPLVLMLRRQWHWLPLSLLPLAFIALWSGWNLYEYGGVHLLEREAGDPSLRGLFVRTLAIFTCIGAISPFTPAMLRPLPVQLGKHLLLAWGLLLSMAIVFTALVYFGVISEPVSDQVLRVTFTLNGVLIMVLCARFLPWSFSPTRTDQWTLGLWAFGLAAFLACFSPMMASRHILLIIPPVLLLTAPAMAKAPRREKTLAVACTAILGLLLTISDKQYAGFYRDSAPQIAEQLSGKNGTVWSLGHWGWQWYSEKAGMKVYGRTQSHVSIGDYIVIPEDYDRQRLAQGIEKIKVATWTEAPGPFNFFCVEQFAGMYTSSYGKLPWSLSRSHTKTINVYRVTAVHSAEAHADVAPVPTFAP
jgi:hypothetical protein